VEAIPILVYLNKNLANKCQPLTCDMTIMLPSSARRMSLGRYPRLRKIN
jgi:hypothetical protein